MAKKKDSNLKKVEIALDDNSTIDLESMKIHLKPSKRKTVKKIKIVLEGNLNISNSIIFLDHIRPVFDNFDYVDFFLTAPESIDLSFIQSLYHLKTYYANHNKNVSVDSDISGEAKKMIVNSGFEPLLFIPKLV